MNDGVKLVFKIKITTENDVIFFAYLQTEKEVGVIFTNTGVAMQIEKAHIKMSIMTKNKHTCCIENGMDLEEGTNDSMQSSFNRKNEAVSNL